MTHPTILCGLRQLQQQLRLEKAEEAKKATASGDAAPHNKGNGKRKSQGRGKAPAGVNGSAGPSGSRSGQNEDNQSI